MEEPTFRRRSIEYWLVARLDSDDETRWEAVDAIRHICDPASSVPLLLDSLVNDRYPRARALAAHALFDLAIDRVEGLDWQKILPVLVIASDDPSDDVREQVADILKVLQEFWASRPQLAD